MRILIPFLSGILFCRLTGVEFNSGLLILIAFIILLFLYWQHHVKKKSGFNYLFLLSCDLFLFLSAILSCFLNNPLHQSQYFGHAISNGKIVWEGTVIEIPKESDKFYRTILEVKSVQVGGYMKNVCGKAQVYFKKPFLIEQAFPGMRLSFTTEFRNIPSPSNPFEFNYRQFMNNKGIYFQTFVNPNEVKIVGQDEGFSLVNSGAKIKHRIIQSFRSGKLSVDAANLCAALLTGYDDELSAETINAFAHSGTLHVLSVSGLHTGIVYSVIMFLLGIADKHNRFKKIKLLILLLSLWSFVFIAGFSPPVLRAAIMLSFIAVGKFSFNYFGNVSLNLLAVSAFVLLLFNPLLLVDTGFLLSYTAVLGILIFYPHMKSWLHTDSNFLNKIWELCCVSVSATVSTLPLTLLLFHQFPLWFVFTNLVIIPICSVIMLVSILYLFKLTFLVSIINFLTVLVFWLVDLTNNAGTGYIDKIDFTLVDFSFLVSILFVFYWMLKQKKFSLVLSALLLILFWQIFNIITVTTAKNEVSCTIYHVNKKYAMDLKNADCLFFTSKLNEKDYNFHIRNNHSGYNYPFFYDCQIGYIKSNGFSLLMIQKTSMISLVNLLRPSVVVFTNNTFPQEEMKFAYKPKMVIADGACDYKCLKKISLLCKKNDLNFYSTREFGFLKVSLN